MIDNLFITKDISQTDLDLLSYIEDELLLGQSYFNGFLDKRAAAKFSSILYRSKGTKYSIQQFFRTFFGIDPDIAYTKNNVFTVGAPTQKVSTRVYLTQADASGNANLDIINDVESFIVVGYNSRWNIKYNTTANPVIDPATYVVALFSNSKQAVVTGLTPSSFLVVTAVITEELDNLASQIGPNSERYLTNDKLYQTFAIQIKSELPSETWRSVYKTFVHPAGMYLGAEIQIVGFVDMNVESQPNPGILDLPPREIEGSAAFNPAGFAQHTGLFNMAAEGEVVTLFRTNLGSEATYPNPGGNDLNDVQDLSIQELDLNYSSLGEYLTPDSPTFDDDDDINSINGEETMDQEKFTWIEQNDSDGEKTLAELL